MTKHEVEGVKRLLAVDLEARQKFQATLDEASILFGVAIPTAAQVAATSILKAYYGWDEVDDPAEIESDFGKEEREYYECLLLRYREQALEILEVIK